MISQSRNYDQSYNIKAHVFGYETRNISLDVYPLAKTCAWQRRGENCSLGLLVSTALSVSGGQHLPMAIARQGVCCVEVASMSPPVSSSSDATGAGRRFGVGVTVAYATGSGGGVAGGALSELQGHP